MQSYSSARRLGLALAAAILFSPLSATADSVRMTTDFGPVSLDVEPDGAVWGEYPDYKGQLVGKLTGDGLMDLVWLQPNSEMRCASARHGTRYWGTVRWKVSGDSVRGFWNYCDGPLSRDRAWNGSVLSGASALAPAAPKPVSDIDVAQAVRFEWGQYAAGAGDYTALEADINCDGALDRIVYRTDRDNPDGPFFNVMGLAYWKGELLTDSLSLGFNTDDELSVCSMEGAPGPEVVAGDLSFEKEELLNMTGFNGLCGREIRIDDGMCDSTWLFWSNETVTEGHFVTFRN